MSSYRHLKRLAERSGVREVRWSSQLETAVTPVAATNLRGDLLADTRGPRASLDIREYGLQYILYHWRDRCRRIGSQTPRIVLV